MSLRLSRKQVACRQASLKYRSKKGTLATATYRHNMKDGNEVCLTSTPSSDLQGLNAESNWRFELLNSSAHSKTLNPANFDLI
jgi:hypothetical protein